MKAVSIRPRREPLSSRAQAFQHYRVLGGVLRSDLPFPDLPPVPGENADWVLEIRWEGTPAPAAELLGERRIGAERYQLYRHEEGFLLRYSHAGCFDIRDDGTHVGWYPAAGALDELARAIVLGPVLSLALELRGFLCLHGSAVAIDGRAVGFLGGKFHGKSTLATALTSAGATLISDDLLAVSPGPAPRVRAGVPSVRLWGDAASELDIDRWCTTVLPGIKSTASGFAGRTLSTADAPLDALYLLDPVHDADEPRCCWRGAIRGAQAAVALAHQTKLPPTLVGPAAAGVQLRRAASLATTVPVWRLALVRDFGRLSAVARQITEWHAAGAETG